MNSKGKMAILHLEKYGQILYQKIALRVRVPTQQTAHDFEFSSAIMPVLLKCVWLAEGRSTCRTGHLDMSSVPRVELLFLVFGQRGVGHVEWGISTCRGGPGKTPSTLFMHIKLI